MPNTKATEEEKRTDITETDDSGILPKLFISPIEKFVNESDGSGNIHQQVCNTSKNQYDASNGEIALYGLSFTEAEQIGKWVSRSNGCQKQWSSIQFLKILGNYKHQQGDLTPTSKCS